MCILFWLREGSQMNFIHKKCKKKVNQNCSGMCAVFRPAGAHSCHTNVNDVVGWRLFCINFFSALFSLHTSLARIVIMFVPFVCVCVFFFCTKQIGFVGWWMRAFWRVRTTLTERITGFGYKNLFIKCVRQLKIRALCTNDSCVNASSSIFRIFFYIFISR